MNKPNLVEKNRRSSIRRHANSKVKVTCRKGSQDLGQNLAVSVLDIAEGGVRLVVKAELDIGQSVFIGLEGILHRRPVCRTGTVVRSVRTASGDYCVGILLDKYLAYADIGLLA